MPVEEREQALAQDMEVTICRSGEVNVQPDGPHQSGMMEMQ